MEICKDRNNKLMLIWSIPIQVLTTVKKDKKYHSFKVSFPLDLKNYIERNIGSLEKIEFYKIPSTSVIVSGHDGADGVNGSGIAIATGGPLPDGSELVSDPNLVSFKKKSQLFVTLPKKVSMFKNLDANVKSMLKYSLVYDYNVGDYILLVNVVNSDIRN